MKSIKIIQNVISVLENGGDLPIGFTMPSCPSNSLEESSLNHKISKKLTKESAVKQNENNKEQYGVAPKNVGQDYVAINNLILNSVSGDSKPPNSAIEHAPSALVDHIKASLEAQVKLCTSLASQYFKMDKKDLALSFHKRKKQCASDLETLENLKVACIAGLTPIKFHYESISFDEVVMNSDLPLNVLKIEILNCTKLNLKGSSEIQAQVVVESGFQKKNGNEISMTPIIKSSEPG